MSAQIDQSKSKVRCGVGYVSTVYDFIIFEASIDK